MTTIGWWGVSTKKCGTCMYFEDAGMASSGWCRHPSRVEIQNLVLVRKSELACRNSWDQDLWKDRELAGSSGIPKPFKPNSYHAANAQRESKSAVVTADKTTVVSSMTDQVYAIDLAPVRKVENQSEEKQYQKETPFSKQLMKPFQPTRPPRKPSATTYDDQQLPSIDLDTTNIDQRSRIVVDAQADELDHDPVSATPFPTQLPKKRSWDKGEADRRPDEGKQPENAQQTEPLPKTTFRALSYRHSSIAAHSSDQFAQFVTLDSKKSKFKQKPEISNIAAADQIPAPEINEMAELPPDTIDPIDRADLLEGVTKCCGTCLDFIPSGDGTTGTCTNAYAFSAQRMVKSDELACRTSIGVWWLPNNDIVHDNARIVRHTRPTPHIDSYLNRRR